MILFRVENKKKKKKNRIIVLKWTGNITSVCNMGEEKKTIKKVTALDREIKFYFICDKNNNIRTFFHSFLWILIKKFKSNFFFIFWERIIY